MNTTLINQAGTPAAHERTVDYSQGATCCICGCTIPTVYVDGHPTTIGQNNPDPIVSDEDAVCCSNCNEKYVLPARMGASDRWIRWFRWKRVEASDRTDGNVDSTMQLTVDGATENLRELLPHAIDWCSESAVTAGNLAEDIGLYAEMLADRYDGTDLSDAAEDARTAMDKLVDALSELENAADEAARAADDALDVFRKVVQ